MSSPGQFLLSSSLSWQLLAVTVAGPVDLQLPSDTRRLSLIAGALYERWQSLLLQSGDQHNAVGPAGRV